MYQKSFALLILAFALIIHNTLSAECGKKSTTPKSTSGERNASIEFPWHVGIYRYKTLIASGVLVSERAILTAVRPIFPFPFNVDLVNSTHEIIVGKLTSDSGTIDTTFQRTYKVKKILGEEGENALALLVTAEKIEFNDFVQPACIDTSGKPFNLTAKSVGELVIWDKPQKVIRNLTDFYNLDYIRFTGDTTDYFPEDIDLGNGLFFHNDGSSSDYVRAIFHNYVRAVNDAPPLFETGFNWGIAPVTLRFVNLDSGSHLEWLKKNIAVANTL